MAAGRKFIPPNLACETMLTVGSALHEILQPSCGVISIGPFACRLGASMTSSLARAGKG